MCESLISFGPASATFGASHGRVSRNRLGAARENTSGGCGGGRVAVHSHGVCRCQRASSSDTQSVAASASELAPAPTGPWPSTCGCRPACCPIRGSGVPHAHEAHRSVSRPARRPAVRRQGHRTADRHRRHSSRSPGVEAPGDRQPPHGPAEARAGPRSRRRTRHRKRESGCGDRARPRYPRRCRRLRRRRLPP